LLVVMIDRRSIATRTEDVVPEPHGGAGEAGVCAASAQLHKHWPPQNHQWARHAMSPWEMLSNMSTLCFGMEVYIVLTRGTHRALLRESLVKLYYLYLLILLNKYHNIC
jgi:hypothetical protein